MGLHSGCVVSGILSFRLPKFYVLGDAVRTAKTIAKLSRGDGVCCSMTLYEQCDTLSSDGAISNVNPLKDVRVGAREITVVSGTWTKAFRERPNAKRASPVVPIFGLFSPVTSNRTPFMGGRFLQEQSDVSNLSRSSDDDGDEGFSEFRAALRKQLTEKRTAPSLKTSQLLLVIFGYRMSVIKCDDSEAYEEAAFLGNAYPREVTIYSYLAQVVLCIHLASLALLFVPYPGNSYYGGLADEGYRLYVDLFIYVVVCPVTLMYPVVARTAFFQQHHQSINVMLNCLWVLARLATDASLNPYPQYGMLALHIVLIYECKLIFFYIRVLLATSVALAYYSVVTYLQTFTFTSEYVQIHLTEKYGFQSRRRDFDDEVGERIGPWMAEFLNDSQCDADGFAEQIMSSTYRFVEDHVMTSAVGAASHFFTLIFLAWALAVPSFLDEVLNRMAFHTKLTLDQYKELAIGADRKYNSLLVKHYPNVRGLPSGTDAAANYYRDYRNPLWLQRSRGVTLVCLRAQHFHRLVQDQDPEWLIMKQQLVHDLLLEHLQDAGLFVLEFSDGIITLCDILPSMDANTGECSTRIVPASQMEDTLVRCLSLSKALYEQDVDLSIAVAVGEVATCVVRPAGPRYMCFGRCTRTCKEILALLENEEGEQGGVLARYNVLCTSDVVEQYRTSWSPRRSRGKDFIAFDPLELALQSGEQCFGLRTELKTARKPPRRSESYKAKARRPSVLGGLSIAEGMSVAEGIEPTSPERRT
eukprot:scaffold4274_cov267-Pinguiococcus_pyrenoidosus.AAC.1